MGLAEEHEKRCRELIGLADELALRRTGIYGAKSVAEEIDSLAGVGWPE